MGASVRPTRDAFDALWDAAPAHPTPGPAHAPAARDAFDEAWDATPGGAPESELARLGHNTRDVAREVIGQGALAKWGDEIEAGIRAPFSSRTYPEIRDEIRGQMHAFQGEHPKLAAGLELAGMLTPGLATGARGSATAPLSPMARMGAATATGAGYGAVAGAGGSEGGVGDRAQSGLMGAVLGGAFGAGLSLLGQGAVGLAQSYQVVPRVLNAAAAAVPSSRIAAALRARATAAVGRTADRAYTARLAQDGATPAQAAATARSVHPDIPIAAADLGGENVRQMTGAVKRLPGPQKQLITKTLQTRAENAPVNMLGSLERNAPEASQALGIPATAGIDTRLANPNDIATAARAELNARFAPRYQALLSQPTQYDAQALDDVGRLFSRPSMQQHGIPYAERIAGEADETLGTLPTGSQTVPHPSGLVGPNGQPLTTTVPTGRTPAPTAQQLHHAKVGADRHILDVQDKIAAAEAIGDPARGLRADLRGLLSTRGELVDAIDRLVPGYKSLSADYAREVQPIDAFRQGQGTSPLTPPWQAQSTVQDLAANPNAQTALGAGYGRRLADEVQRAANTNQNPARVVAGTGSAAASKTQILRTFLGSNADPILRDADAIDRMAETNRAALGNSATAERVLETGALGKLLSAGQSVLQSRPLKALDAIMGGEYGPQSEALAQRLMRGANPGERQRLVDWLDQLGRPPASRTGRALAKARGLAPRATGITAGAAAASTTSAR